MLQAVDMQKIGAFAPGLYLSVKRERGQQEEEVLGRKGQFSSPVGDIQEHSMRQRLDSRILVELAHQALVMAHGWCAGGENGGGGEELFEVL